MIELILAEKLKMAVQELYQQQIDDKQIQIQETKKEFDGDFTIVVFPFVRLAKKSPEQTAQQIGDFLLHSTEEISDFNVVKGFLNLVISSDFWLTYLKNQENIKKIGFKEPTSESQTILVEYSSPNTNKPLHLGHIRNNLLGYSVAKILKAAGNKVYKTNIVNDRGIHICKSMLAWQKWGNNITPESANKKGDHLVGDYYVLFDKEYKKEINALVATGMDEDIAKKEAPLLKEAQEMLRKWEAEDSEVRELWKTMNDWVYKGFDVTYKKLGVDFDKIYYESDTFKLGKTEVMRSLKENTLYQKEDNSVWADLTNEGLDHKLLLRSDGTAVYMTQDIGTAILRHNDYKFNNHVYVVGNEQDYHFKVLKILLKKLGYNWADNLFHLSYGMVELPEGKMKSREGKVVDADDLIDKMVKTATEMSKELGKLNEMDANEAEKINYTTALGALKYFILKVDPRKTILFNPKESIDFNGNTGPFIQYTYARIQSLLRKAKEQNISYSAKLNIDITDKEKNLIKLIYKFEQVVQEAAQKYSPALISNFTYELAREFNQFYHDTKVLVESDNNKKEFKLTLSDTIGQVIKNAFSLLGIDVPNRM